jgi:hypothetical protein
MTTDSLFMSEINDLRAQLEASEKQGAEMRTVLTDFIKKVEHGEARSVRTYAAALKATANDCGRDYVHKDKVKPLVDALAKIYNYPVCMEPVGGALAMQDIAKEAIHYAITQGMP